MAESINEKKELTLNGQPVTLEKLNEMKANPSLKIEEVAPGKYISKQRLNG